MLSLRCADLTRFPIERGEVEGELENKFRDIDITTWVAFVFFGRSGFIAFDRGGQTSPIVEFQQLTHYVVRTWTKATQSNKDAPTFLPTAGCLANDENRDGKPDDAPFPPGPLSRLGGWFQWDSLWEITGGGSDNSNGGLLYIQCKFCFKDKVTITVDGKNCPIVKTPFVDGQQFTGTSTGNDTVIICKGPEGFGRNVPLIIKKVARTSPEYSISYSPPEIIDSTPSSWQSQTDVCGKDSLYLGMCAKTDNTTIITFKGKNFGSLSFL